MPDSGFEPAVLPRRLCSEIQLFDLCDLDSCIYKKDRFCTDPVLLGRFEKIAEDELRTPERYVSEEIDDAEADGGDGDGYDDEDDLTTENFECNENDGWENEE